MIKFLAQSLFITLYLFGSTAHSDSYTDGMSAFEIANYQKAFRVLNPLAKKGHAKAQYFVGFMYWTGFGTAKDKNKARYWLMKSAAQDNTDAKDLVRTMESGLINRSLEVYKVGYLWPAHKNFEAGNTKKSITLLKSSIDYLKKKLGKDTVYVGRAYLKLGSMYNKQGKHDEALQSLESGLKTLIEARGLKSRELGYVYYNISKTYSARSGNDSDKKLAIAYINKAIAFAKKIRGTNHMVTKKYIIHKKLLTK